MLPAPVRPAFNWIEVFAIPVSANIMETQPIVLLLFFLAVVFAGAGTPVPLGEAGITLLLLGLQWWAMFINYRLRQGMEQRTATILHVSGVVFAFGLALLTNLTTFDLPMIIVIAGLVIFCWKRGIDKAKEGLYDEQLIFVFKLGVGILLVVLTLSVLSPNGPLQYASVTLGYALPLFFLSGLIALSFMRVSMIRREHARQGIPQANSTSWLACGFNLSLGSTGRWGARARNVLVSRYSGGGASALEYSCLHCCLDYLCYFLADAGYFSIP